MDLRIKRETFAAPEDHRWLGSAHGTEATDSITLDGANFIGTFTDGIVPSGVVVGRRLSDSKWVRATDANISGTPTVDASSLGFLFTTKDIGAGDGPIGAALLTHGKIQQDFLPDNHGLTAALKTAMGTRFTYKGTLA